MKQPLNTAAEHLASQREYVKKRHLEDQKAAAQTGGTAGLVDEKMLAESMRSVRYADEAHAAGDIIDNAIEAGASQVHLVYRTEGAKITEIAFIDDAAGIDPAFLPHAVKWGGSSNEGKRNVFGRFGFGLPSASVNRGRKFSVYSRTGDGQLFAKVAVDLDNLIVEGQTVQLPAVTEEPLPGWVVQYIDSGKVVDGQDAVRTVVVWSTLDRLTWPNVQQSSGRFREQLGITYAGWLDVCKLYIDGDPVEPVDVLFTTPGYRYYDIPGSPNAESHSPIRFTANDPDGNEHTVTVRFSLLGTAAYKAAVNTGGKGRPAHVRQRIRTAYNGFFVTRNGRFIELARPDVITWNNYARQVGVAIDFPPELDELFGVTPDKQTIIFTERLERMLDAAGVIRAHRALVREIDLQRKQEKAERDAAANDGEATRASEKTIAKAVEKEVRRTRKASKESQEEAQRNFDDTVKRLAKETGVDEKEVAKAQERKHREKPYRVEFSTDAEDDPFYTPLMVGSQTVLRINQAHAWYRELYSKLNDDQAELRSGLELMLWVLATNELDATGDQKIFYRAERRAWSRQLSTAFDLHPAVFNNATSREDVEEDDPAAWVEEEFSDDDEFADDFESEDEAK
ncbi:ATP-binding protein [Microbacterium sp. NPDC055502]